MTNKERIEELEKVHGYYKGILSEEVLVSLDLLIKEEIDKQKAELEHVKDIFQKNLKDTVFVAEILSLVKLKMLKPI